MNDVLNNKAVAYAAGALAFGLVVYFIGKKLFDAAGDAIGSVANAAKAVGTAINPVDDQNLANRAVGAIGATVTGNESWSLGGAIYDLFHPYDPNAPTKKVQGGLPIRPEDRPSSLR